MTKALSLIVFAELSNVTAGQTDGQTDRQTDRIGITVHCEGADSQPTLRGRCKLFISTKLYDSKDDLDAERYRACIGSNDRPSIKDIEAAQRHR